MSVPVALDELRRQVEAFGAHPFLITTSLDRRAHVVSVTTHYDGERFSTRAGRTSQANLGTGSSVTLLWRGTDGRYGLIVDGDGRLDGDVLVVIPARAVLHRLADAPDDLPSCVPIEPAGGQAPT